MDISKKYYGCFDPLPDRSSNPTALVIHHVYSDTKRNPLASFRDKCYRVSERTSRGTSWNNGLGNGGGDWRLIQ